MSSLRGLNFNQFTSLIGCSKSALNQIINNITDHYRTHVLRKEDKKRKLWIPDSELKGLQRRIYNVLFSDYSYLDPVYCCPGRSSIEAAQRHVQHSHLLHVDIEKFFPSTSISRVQGALRFYNIGDRTVNVLTQLITLYGSLPQGAPTSPAIANIVLEKLDKRIQTLCETHGEGLTYTRYLDDIAISGGSRLTDFEDHIREIIDDEGWDLNHKGKLYGPEEKHYLLGVIPGVQMNVEEQYIRDLRTLLQKIKENEMTPDHNQLQSIESKIDWIENVNNSQGRQLSKLYKNIVRS